MTNSRSALWLACLTLGMSPTRLLAHQLIVVEDRGGASALPYYRAINLLPGPNDLAHEALPPAPAIPHERYSERDFLPVHSLQLKPGRVRRRVIATPGLAPLCLIGDDPLSRAWLKERLATLRAIHAVGLIVEVSSYAQLAALRRLAPGVTLVPASGDSLARRLDLHHYPVLITATGIEQ